MNCYKCSKTKFKMIYIRQLCCIMNCVLVTAGNPSPLVPLRCASTGPHRPPSPPFSRLSPGSLALSQWIAGLQAAGAWAQ